MSKIAIITARGGSKRIPRKNIKEFCGKPILVYSIEAALKSGVFDEVMVSTDDEEIAEIAREAGAVVPFLRSKETSNDTAVIADVLCEVINEYEKRGKSFETGCCIYPTAPFITKEKIILAMDMLEKESADVAISVVEFSFAPQRGVYILNNKCKPVQQECMRMRSQDLQKVYHDCGQFFAFNVEAMKKNKIVWGNNVVPVVLNEMEVQDIDTETDWKLAELKYKLLNGEI